MSEEHDQLVSKYRQKLIRDKFKLERAQLVDYRPDIYASKGKNKVIVEVEIGKTINGDHTFKQLELMHKYIRMSRNTLGVLLVPQSVKKEALFLVDSVFGDGRIKVKAM